MTTLVQATEVTALIIGIGGAGAVVYKGTSALRRLGHFVDKMAGNGDSEPGVIKRLEELKRVVEDLAHGQVLLQQGQDALTVKLNDHVDGDAKKWLADGQAWGNRLDDQVANLNTRVARLEHP